MSNQNTKLKNVKSKNTKTTVRAKRNTKNKKNKLSKLQYEALVLVALAIGLLIIISVYFNGGGLIGKGIKNFIFGVFGIGGWLVPIFVFIGAFLKIFNKENERLNTKLLLIGTLLIFFSVACHILFAEKAQLFIKVNDKSVFFATLANFYKVSTTYYSGGGFLGGLIGDILMMFLGKVGSLIIIIMIYIFVIVAITELSFIEFSKKFYAVFVMFLMLIVKKISEMVSKIKSNQAKKKIQKKKIKSPIVKKEKETIDFEIKQEKDFIQSKPIKNTIKQEKIEKPKEDKQLEITIQEQEEIEIKTNNSQVQTGEYIRPDISLLRDNPVVIDDNEMELNANAIKLEETLASFGVNAKVVDYSKGPTVTRYEIQPDVGVKVNKIVNLADDLALNLAATGIRIEAPIPGKSAVGIEVPNEVTSSVYLKEVIDTDEFRKFPSNLSFALGKDIEGSPVIFDIARMPHLLIAGATGSGKSVCVNTIITSILFKAKPEEVKLLMIDPKVVELSVYNGIPHLLIPVVTDPSKAAGALNWAVKEMLDRYKLFSTANVRDFKAYNECIEGNEDGLRKLPQIVIIVDELADLMVSAAKDVESAICRLAQMARAAGLHLIIATQRPSVDVITGLIKSNIPSRIAFNVSSGIDSRTILDMVGAEKLIGKGDMLFYPVGYSKPVRIQGAFISDKEVEDIVDDLKKKKKQEYDQKILEQLSKNTTTNETKEADDLDVLFEEVLKLCVKQKKASASMIQRKFRVGYNRAARIMDQLYEAGYVGEEEGSKPRKVLLNSEGLDELINKKEGKEMTNQNNIS